MTRMLSVLLLFSLLAWGSCGLLLPVRFRDVENGDELPQVFYRGIWHYFDYGNQGEGFLTSALCLSAGYMDCCGKVLRSCPMDWQALYTGGAELANNSLEFLAINDLLSQHGTRLYYDGDCLGVNRTGASITKPPWVAYHSPFHGIDAPSLALVNNTLSLTVVIASLPDTVTTLTLAAEGQPLEHELTTVIGGASPKASPYWTFSVENYNAWYTLWYASISVPWVVVSSKNVSIGSHMLITQDSSFTNFHFTLTASSTSERLLGSASSTNLLPFVVKMPRVATATLTFSTDYVLANTTDFWVTFTTGNTRQDARNKTATVEFWTSVPLPYHLNSSTIKAVSPAGTAVSVRLVSGTSCPTSPCVQQWVFSFADVCNLHLVMVVSFRIACSSTEPCAVGGQDTDTTVVLDFVASTCNPVVIIPSATIALELHKGAADTPSVTTIASGDQATLEIRGTSTGAVLTNVQVDSIVYWSNAGNVAGPKVTLMAGGVCSSPKCASNAMSARSVGADGAEISFTANCGAGSLVLFEQGIDSVVPWTFQVGVIFTYEGQQKRSYLATSAIDSNAEVYTFVVDTKTDSTNPAGVHSPNVGPVVVMLVAALLLGQHF